MSEFLANVSEQDRPIRERVLDEVRRAAQEALGAGDADLLCTNSSVATATGEKVCTVHANMVALELEGLVRRVAIRGRSVLWGPCDE